MILYSIITIQYKDKIFTDYNGPISIKENSFDELNEINNMEYINRYIIYYIDTIINSAINNIKGLKKSNFNKNNKYLEIIIQCDYIKDTNYELGYCDVLTYKYNYFDNYSVRYINNGNELFRNEVSDKNTLQKFYPIGSKIKLRFSVYNITEGIIVGNEAENINNKDFSNVYRIQIKGRHGKPFISTFYPHYMDIIDSDKEPYELFKEEIK